MVLEQVIRDRKGKSIMGRDHDAEAYTSGDETRTEFQKIAQEKEILISLCWLPGWKKKWHV